LSSQNTVIIKKPFITINDFLKQFKEFEVFNLQKGVKFDFDFSLRTDSQKICPIIQVAKPEDAEEIAQIFKQTYKGCYPYIEAFDSKEIYQMIKDPTYHWFLYKIKPNIVVGCIGVHLEFEKKRGYHFGYVIKEKYQRLVDTIKMFAGYLIILWKIYKNKILVWYSETRTAHSVGQYGQNLCGLIPIAFFPNKDIFSNRVESDFMHISYDRRVLKEYRHKSDPKIIRQVLNCYLYSNEKYHLGLPRVENPELNLNLININKIKKKLIRKIENEREGYVNISYFIKNSNSYFKFVHNIYNQTFEKSIYEINDLEELYVFLQEVREHINQFNIRYFECFVSSYEPTHQRIFYDSGFEPRGYVPCWKYNKEENIFEDQIVFNYFKGTVDKNMKTTPETLYLLQTLDFMTKKEQIFLNDNKILFKNLKL